MDRMSVCVEAVQPTLISAADRSRRCCRMDQKSFHGDADNTKGGAINHPNQSECISAQPTPNGAHRCTAQAPPPISDRLQEADSSDESLTDSSSSKDVSRLLPPPHRHKGVDSSSQAPPATPTSSSAFRPASSGKRVSTMKSHASFKTDAAHIKEVAGNDCCAHCLLACLFCELLSMFYALGECLACGVGGATCCDVTACCCCVEAAGQVACTEEACQAVLDCGMLENCCSSSDCLEICLECCAIVFPS